MMEHSAIDWQALIDAIENTLREVSTVPPLGADRTQADNQAAFDKELMWARNVAFNPEMPDDEVWRIISVIPFYSGVIPPEAARIERTREWLRDYHEVAQPGWLESKRGRAYVAEAEGFKEQKLTDEGKPRAYYNRNEAKGPKIVATAQHLVRRQKVSGNTLINILVPAKYRRFHPTDLQAIKRNFESELGYGPIIDWHAMMELGIPCVKPDRMLTRTAIRLGLMPVYTNSKGDNYPRLGLTAKDAMAFGADPYFARALQAKVTEAKEATGRSMRELDWLLAKMGMTDTLEEGREFVVCDTTPRCTVCKAHQFCAYGRREHPIKVETAFPRSRARNSKSVKPPRQHVLPVAAE